MPPRSLFPPTSDAPVRVRLVMGWGLFFLFVMIGLWFFLTKGGAVPSLVDVVHG